MTARGRRQSIDEPGFWGYIGGGRHLRDPQPLDGNACRAMFEFMPADEDCWGKDCRICKQPRQRQEGGGHG